MSTTLRQRAGLATAGTAGLLAAWGRQSRATRLERHKPLPGDELVPHPKWQATRATTIRAPRDQVWPWLGAAGFYDDILGATTDAGGRVCGAC